MNKIIQENK